VAALDTDALLVLARALEGAVQQAARSYGAARHRTTFALEGKLLVYTRDDAPSIPFPGLLDLPGGCTEGDEILEECVPGEPKEGFSTDPTSPRFIYKEATPNQSDTVASHCLVVEGPGSEVVLPDLLEKDSNAN
jgi:hypothetical protein